MLSGAPNKSLLRVYVQALERSQVRVLRVASAAWLLILVILLPWAAALRKAFYLPAQRRPSSLASSCFSPQLAARQQRIDRLHAAVDGMKYHDLERQLTKHHCPGAGLAATVPEMRELLKVCLVPRPSAGLTAAHATPSGGVCGRGPTGAACRCTSISRMSTCPCPPRIFFTRRPGLRGGGAGHGHHGRERIGQDTLVSVLRGVSERDKVVRGWSRSMGAVPADRPCSPPLPRRLGLRAAE
jgi:hypothetical protein